MDLKFNINMAEVAAKLNQTEDLIRNKVHEAAERLTISTHAFLLNKAQSELKGMHREAYLGKNGSNLRWTKVGKGLWVVEVRDEPQSQDGKKAAFTARMIEEGNPSRQMATSDWLLKPDKVKTAKDGSTYRVIPISHEQGAGGSSRVQSYGSEARFMISSALRDNKIKLNKLERDYFGTPFGKDKPVVLHKIDMSKYEPSRDKAHHFSKSRTPLEAAQGLKPYEGKFKLEGLAIVQRPNPKAKHGVTREAVTFRVVSSKHAGSRWIYPEIKPFNGIQSAYEFAQREWDVILKDLENQFNSNT